MHLCNLHYSKTWIAIHRLKIYKQLHLLWCINDIIYSILVYFRTDVGFIKTKQNKTNKQTNKTQRLIIPANGCIQLWDHPLRSCYEKMKSSSYSYFSKPGRLKVNLPVKTKMFWRRIHSRNSPFHLVLTTIPVVIETNTRKCNYLDQSKEPYSVHVEFGFSLIIF